MAKLGRDGTAGSSTGGSRASITAGRAKITVVRPKPKPASAETVKVQKSSVRVKPAAKQVGNPPNKRKAEESRNSGASRLGSGSPTLGKSRDTRVARSASPAGKRMAKAERKQTRARKAGAREQMYYDGYSSGYGAGNY